MKALFELTLVVNVLLAPFLAVVTGSLRVDPRVPRWLVVASAVAAVAFAVPIVGYAHSGPPSPEGGQQIVYQGLILWLLAAGIAWPAHGRVSERRTAT